MVKETYPQASRQPGYPAEEGTTPKTMGERDIMRSAVYAEKTLHVGTATLVDSLSPQGGYAVAFEDDSVTGFFYALDTSKKENPILDALHIYNVESVVDREVASTLQIVWSTDGLKAALVINDYPHAVFDFEARRGYCRSGFPPPDKRWTQYGHE
jgi:hypothetical protein